MRKNQSAHSNVGATAELHICTISARQTCSMNCRYLWGEHVCVFVTTARETHNVCLLLLCSPSVGEYHFGFWQPQLVIKNKRVKKKKKKPKWELRGFFWGDLMKDTEKKEEPADSSGSQATLCESFFRLRFTWYTESRVEPFRTRNCRFGEWKSSGPRSALSQNGLSWFSHT